MIQTTNNPSPTLPKAVSKSSKQALWCTRIVFGLVFIINVQCALQFVFIPDAYVGAYELEGISGIIALQGMGIAFLMWNATYPLYLINPIKYPTLGIIILAQQMIGLIGESTLLFSLPPEHDLLYDSIVRFICFDGIGLVVMGVAYALLYTTLRQAKRNHH